MNHSVVLPMPHPLLRYVRTTEPAAFAPPPPPPPASPAPSSPGAFAPSRRVGGYFAPAAARASGTLTPPSMPPGGDPGAGSLPAGARASSPGGGGTAPGGTTTTMRSPLTSFALNPLSLLAAQGSMAPAASAPGGGGYVDADGNPVVSGGGGASMPSPSIDATGISRLPGGGSSTPDFTIAQPGPGAGGGSAPIDGGAQGHAIAPIDAPKASGGGAALLLALAAAAGVYAATR